ncbi:MAG: proprotein convertase P-domain-containing protein [Acidobacteria bacterium]|nr:proprotein convertase P-domain-containing protein [Acidobacteriota bacterium]
MKCSVQAGRIAFLAIIALAVASGATISASGAGGAIPDCVIGVGALNCDQGPGTPGLFQSTINIAAAGSILAAGNNLTLTLTEMSHTWLGDLQMSLEHVGFGGATFLFRPGANINTDTGYGTNLSGTYRFNNNFTGNPWTSTTTLPAGDYYPTGASYSSAETPFSDFFNGQIVAGDWRLTIRDLNDMDTGSLGSWSLDIETPSEIPEPAQVLPLLGALLAGAWRLRRRQ